MSENLILTTNFFLYQQLSFLLQIYFIILLLPCRIRSQIFVFYIEFLK